MRIPSMVPAICVVLTLAACADGESEPKVASASGAKDAEEAALSEDDAVERYLAKQQAFVDCARKNGAPDMQDPDEFGAVALGDLPEGDVARKIIASCRPIIDGVTPPPELQERMRDLAADQMTPEQKKIEADFARCMQENGVPGYPDPEPNGLPRIPEWDLPGSTTSRPPGLDRANDACLPLRGGGPEDGTS